MIEPEIDRERRVVEIGVEAPSPTSCSSGSARWRTSPGCRRTCSATGSRSSSCCGRGRTTRGSGVYRKHDVQMVLRIKSLLYEDRLTLEGAKKRLQQEGRQRNQQLDLPAPDPQTLAALSARFAPGWRRSGRRCDELPLEPRRGATYNPCGFGAWRSLVAH